MPTLEQGTVNTDRSIIGHLLHHNAVPFLDERKLPSLGAYADVIQGGDISIGDDVVLIN